MSIGGANRGVIDPASVVTSDPTVTGGGFYVNDVYLPITPVTDDFDKAD